MKQISVNQSLCSFQCSSIKNRSKVTSQLLHQGPFYHLQTKYKYLWKLWKAFFSHIKSIYLAVLHRIIRIQVYNRRQSVFMGVVTEVQWRDVNSSVKFQGTILWFGEMEDKIGNRSQITRRKSSK